MAPFGSTLSTLKILGHNQLSMRAQEFLSGVFRLRSGAGSIPRRPAWTKTKRRTTRRLQCPYAWRWGLAGSGRLPDALKKGIGARVVSRTVASNGILNDRS